MLNYTRKIFASEGNNVFEKLNEMAWDGESVDEAQQLLMDDQDRKENVKLQRLIEHPLYTYKGIVYSDGILSKNLKVIPVESIEDTINAKCQFRKCVFRVEIFDNCTYH